MGFHCRPAQRNRLPNEEGGAGGWRISARRRHRSREGAAVTDKTMTPAEVLDAIGRLWLLGEDACQDDWDKARAAVAALVAENARMYEALTWALGANGDFRTQRTVEGPFYWRGELAERAGLFWNGEHYLHRPTSAALAGASND